MIEGKTKIVTPLWEGSDIGLVTTKDDITAGDGAKHDIMVGKAELATRTTCNVFEFLAGKNLPLAYIGRDSPTTFLTRICEMIEVEVVVRGIATGTYLKRHPSVVEGCRFMEPKLEFFLKTTGCLLGSMELPCDDPLMLLDDAGSQFRLHLPNKPIAEGLIGPFDQLEEDVKSLVAQLEECGEIAIRVFELLQTAWKELGGTLYDFKLEFGILPDGTIVVADVIDCDSWRVMWNDIKLSKQGYRDGDDLDKVLGVYRLAASLTDQLRP